jgi:hypothetical protein
MHRIAPKCVSLHMSKGEAVELLRGIGRQHLALAGPPLMSGPSSFGVGP